MGGRLHGLWRAVDEHGQTLDVFLQARRDTAAAARFFRRLLDVSDGVSPERVTTDRLGSYAAALGHVPELAGVEHLQVRAARRCNNRVEQAHQATRIRECVATWREIAQPARRLTQAAATRGARPRPPAASAART